MRLVLVPILTIAQQAGALFSSRPFTTKYKSPSFVLKSPEISRLIDDARISVIGRSLRGPLVPNRSTNLRMAFHHDVSNTTSRPDSDITFAEDCLSFRILLEIIRDIGNSDATPNKVLDGDKVVNIMEEASNLLEDLATRANFEMGEVKAKLVTNEKTNFRPDLHKQLANNGLIAAKSLRKLMSYHGPARGEGRRALMSTLSFILEERNPTKVLSIIIVVAALTLSTSVDPLFNDGDHRSVSRAAVSGLLPNGRYQLKSKSSKDSDVAALDETTSFAANKFGEKAVKVLLTVASTNSSKSSLKCDSIDLHIVTALARSFVSNSKPLASACALVTCQTLALEDYKEESFCVRSKFRKIDAAGALGLASQLGPWSKISPVPLVHISMEMQLWHAAERICESAIKLNSAESHTAVHYLIDGLTERHQYRQSDAIATEFYSNGGRSRYADARFMHACDTIAKVVMKRQYPILERQVERVDKAFERVANDSDVVETNAPTFMINKNGPEEVRLFALTKLREVNEHDTAHRLAQMWNMDYFYNEKDAQKFIEERLEKYLQWTDAFPDDRVAIPEIITSHEDLTKSFHDLLSTVKSALPVIGFDVEWGEMYEGAALLQLSTLETAILIDVPAILDSMEGCNALDKSVGKLFAGKITLDNDSSSSISAAGFSCRQDITRLRASIGVRPTHWFSSTKALFDIQQLVAEDFPKLENFGLSRICENIIGKPLDKAEQCSLWDRRPLSKNQRAYAALDAWAVVAIYSRLMN